MLVAAPPVLSAPPPLWGVLLPVNGKIAVRDERGRAVPPASVEGRPLYRKGAGVFAVGRGGRRVTISPEVAVKRVREDAETQRLRRKWAGRPLWGYGPVGLASYRNEASYDLRAEPTRAVRITGLYRFATPDWVSIALPNGSGEEDITVASPAPILAVVQPARGTEISFASSTAPVGPDLFMVTSKLVWSATYANEAHLMRTFSPRPPTGLALKAARRLAPSRGMTPEQAARAVGYPPLDRTPAYLARLPSWDFPAMTPFQSAVVFRNGRVLRYEPPGDLP